MWKKKQFGNKENINPKIKIPSVFRIKDKNIKKDSKRKNSKLTFEIRLQKERAILISQFSFCLFDDIYNIKNNRYKILCNGLYLVDYKQLLGMGSYGKVYKGCSLNGKQSVAVKFLTFNCSNLINYPITKDILNIKLKQSIFEDKIDDNLDIFLREVKILQQLSHPNIIKLLNYEISYQQNTNEINLHIVFERMEKNIFQLALKGWHLHLSQENAQSIVYQMMSAIDYMHSLKLAHRDIKPSNFLINTEQNLVKLSDFGQSKCLNNIERNSLQCQSKPWRPPEIYLGMHNYDLSVDIWALGVSLFELSMDQYTLLFNGSNKLEFMIQLFQTFGAPDISKLKALPLYEEISYLKGNKIYLSDYTLFYVIMSQTNLRDLILNINSNNENISSTISPTNPFLTLEFIDLINRMIQMDPSQRISAKEALQHNFFQINFQ